MLRLLQLSRTATQFGQCRRMSLMDVKSWVNEVPTPSSSASPAATPSPLPAVTPTIQLVEKEEELRTLLVQCASWVDQHEPWQERLSAQQRYQDGSWKGKEKERVQLRIAGGWVRDKLLGLESDDIDISTSPEPLTGELFGIYFGEYLDATGQSSKKRKLAKMEANAEQSKHLETARTNLLGYDIDFVQLRGGEIYTGDSRIPSAVTFGTPAEDADRRDLTINSLFYNLHTGQVEDFTGKGLSDLLQDRLIRTPLAAERTFQDDPLRAIRAVRFAARFGRQRFRMEDSLVQAMSKENIREALSDPKKISRERVGAELEKMLKGPDPVLSLALIESLGLYRLIFNYPSASAQVDPIFLAADGHELDIPISRAASVLSGFLRAPQDFKLHPWLSLVARGEPEEGLELGVPSVALPAETLRRLYLSAALLPIYPHLLEERGKPLWAGEVVVRDSIKGSSHDRTTTGRLRAGWLLAHVGTMLQEGPLETERQRIGLLLRNPNIHAEGVPWNVTLFWSMIVDLVRADAVGTLDETQKVVARYNAFVERVIELRLHRDFDAKPVIPGKEVPNLIKSIRPGPVPGPSTGIVLQLVVAYQLARPKAESTSPADYMQEVKDHFFADDGAGRAEVLQVLDAAAVEEARQKELKVKVKKKAKPNPDGP